MKIIGIIPARYASSRFPGKPLIDLKGKSMIQRVYEGASKSKLLSEVIVATDDQRIYEHVLGFGGKAIMTGEHHQSGTDRCGEVASNMPAGVIINIQGDEPLIDYRQIDELASVFTNEHVQIASLMSPKISAEDLQNSNRIKVVVDHQNNALYFSRSAIPNHANYSGNPMIDYPYRKHIGVYAYRSNILKELVALEPTILEKVESLEQLRWLYYGYSINMVETTIETPNIDVPEDIEKVLPFL